MAQRGNRGVAVIKEVLAAAAPRPAIESDDQAQKKEYAVRFAKKMAEIMADDLRPKMRKITATTKRSARSERGPKQLDINFSTPELGLALGISLKSVHIRENRGARRYTHNTKRNEEELRIEAIGYHKRQPYAVMIGVLFLPFDSCTDGKRGNPSSFGNWVRHLRPYAGRRRPDGDADRFERIYIGLYEPDGSDLRFFDIEADPPKNERPRSGADPLPLTGSAPSRLVDYREFLNAVHREFLRRNVAEFRWADGGEAPLNVAEIQPLPGEG